MLWATGTPMWGASKELTAGMRKPENDSDVIWNTVELLIPCAQFTVGVRHDGTPFPDLNTEPDLYDTCPEEGVTKQF
jgi:hypothetical protein